MVWAHADQDFLAAGKCFEFRVGILIEYVGSDQENGVFHLGCFQQVINHFDHAIIEVSIRVAKPNIGFLEQRVIAAVHGYDVVQIDRGY
jgi:hypothetical protein